MFNSVGFPEVLVLLLIGLALFGPHRLPGMMRDGGRMLRQLRKMASDAARDVKAEMGPEMAGVSLRSMDPKQIMKDLMLADDHDSTGTPDGAASNEAASPDPAPAEPGPAAAEPNPPLDDSAHHPDA